MLVQLYHCWVYWRTRTTYHSCYLHPTQDTVVQQWVIRCDATTAASWKAVATDTVTRVERHLHTSLRDVYTETFAAAKSSFFCEKISESACDVKAMYRVTNDHHTQTTTSASRIQWLSWGFGAMFSSTFLRKDYECPQYNISSWRPTTRALDDEPPTAAEWDEDRNNCFLLP